MLPQRVIYGGTLYNTLGIVKMNNGTFMIVQNNDKVLSLDLAKTNLNLNLKFEVKEAATVEQALMDFILPTIIEEVRRGKELYALRDDIKTLNKYINTHPELLKNMKLLVGKDEVVKKNMLNLLNYFENALKEEPSLDFTNVTSVTVDGKDYIKYKDENGVKILEDNVSNRNYIEQMELKQKESKIFQTKDSATNTENIIEDMAKFEKKEVELTSVSKNENKNNLESGKKTEYGAMEQYAKSTPFEIIGNKEQGIYYNVREDKVLNPNVVENKVEIKIEDQKTEANISINSNITYPPYDETIVTEYLISMKNNPTANINAFINMYLNDLTIEQIDYVLANYVLTAEQIKLLNEQKSKIQETNLQALNQEGLEKTNEKVLVLKKPEDNKSAAFIDVLMLVFIVGSICGTYLTYFVFGIMS